MLQKHFFVSIGLVFALAACAAPTATLAPTAPAQTAIPLPTATAMATLAPSATPAPTPTPSPSRLPTATLPPPTPTPDLARTNAVAPLETLLKTKGINAKTEIQQNLDGSYSAIARDLANPRHFYFISADNGTDLNEVTLPDFVIFSRWNQQTGNLELLNQQNAVIGNWSAKDAVRLKQIKWSWEGMSHDEQLVAYKFNVENISYDGFENHPQGKQAGDEMIKTLQEYALRYIDQMPDIFPTPQERNYPVPANFPTPPLPPFTKRTIFESSSYLKKFVFIGNNIPQIDADSQTDQVSLLDFVKGSGATNTTAYIFTNKYLYAFLMTSVNQKLIEAKISPNTIKVIRELYAEVLMNLTMEIINTIQKNSYTDNYINSGKIEIGKLSSKLQ